MKILNRYKNTITGLVVVFSFLVTFCICYYTVRYVTQNIDYALIAGLCGMIIVLCYSAIDFFKGLNSGQENEVAEDLRPKGINDSVYPEDGQIPYHEEHKNHVSKKLLRKAL